MATTGAKYPAVASTTSEAPYDHLTWIDPDNIKNNTGSYSYIDDAAFDSGIESYVLKAKGFDFSAIPAGATILGITVKVEAYYTVGACGIALAQLLDVDGAKVGTNLASTPIPITVTTPTVITIGAADNLWGNSLTAAWVKDADFGVALAVIPTGNNSNVYIDYVTMEVTYSLAPIERTINDGIGVTDAKTSLLSLVRILAESLGITDARTLVRTMSRTISDSLGLTDSRMLSWSPKAVTINDSLGLTDSRIVLPIYIHDIYELQAMEDNLSVNYVLANDIDATPADPNSGNWDSDEWPGTTGFRPVGHTPYSIDFTGVLDGNEKK
ncbi:MAG TPA: hypothetical protein VMY06_14545, partial [Sedimentisphaerales bacterium]|nr:hypothetical protein [Sedimentisphaerales bacterium]